MRAVFLILWLVIPGMACAQYPYAYSPYGTPYPPGPHAAPSFRGYPPPPDHAAPASLSRAMLDAHNAVRARVGEPPLAWSPQLAAVAQEWAQRLIVTHSFGHRPANRYGENLYTISGGVASPRQVVDTWAAEARDYDIRGNRCAGMCGHYTQIVWRSTRHVGCAIATDVEREVWVCNYDPPGNVVGYRPY